MGIGVSNGNGENLLVFGYVFKVELRGFVDGIVCGGGIEKS